MTPTATGINNARIAIIGLGYVGLPLAAEFGRVANTIGFDISAKRIEELQAGHDRTRELSGDELANIPRLRYTRTPADIADCNVYIVTVPTPIDSHKRPDLTPLLKASETVGKVLKPGDIVIYESTVYPGATEEDCVPVLEQHAGLTFNKDFYCGYSPERINPGDKQHRVTDIVKVTSGSTPAVANIVDALYSSIIKAGTHKASSIKVAEAAKVIENTQRDLNIALINELSVIFDRLGIDTLEVLQAAGTKWNFLPFRPGLVGGHCIGVDPYYLTHKAEAVGYHPQVILAGRRINDNMARYVARNTIRRMLQNGMDVPRCEVGILGVTFKENCPDTRNSKVIEMVREFEHWGCSVRVADPYASAAELEEEYGLQLRPIGPEHPVDALVVAVSHDAYAELGPEQLRQYVRGTRPVIADIKSLHSPTALQALGFTVFRL